MATNKPGALSLQDIMGGPSPIGPTKMGPMTTPGAKKGLMVGITAAFGKPKAPAMPMPMPKPKPAAKPKKSPLPKAKPVKASTPKPAMPKAQMPMMKGPKGPPSL